MLFTCPVSFQFEGGLYTTAVVVDSAYKLAGAAKQAPQISEVSLLLKVDNICFVFALFIVKQNTVFYMIIYLLLFIYFQDKVIKFANYFLSRKHAQSIKNAATVVAAVKTLTDNDFHIPIAVSLASQVSVSDKYPIVQVGLRYYKSLVKSFKQMISYVNSVCKAYMDNNH